MFTKCKDSNEGCKGSEFLKSGPCIWACRKKTSQIQSESFPKVESNRKPNQLTSEKNLNF